MHSGKKINIYIFPYFPYEVSQIFKFLEIKKKRIVIISIIDFFLKCKRIFTEFYFQGLSILLGKIHVFFFTFVDLIS